MTFPTNTVRVQAEGVDVQLDPLEDLRVRSSLLETSSVTLRFDDTNFALLDGPTFAIGKGITVKLISGSAETTVFDGEVVALGVEQSAGSRHLTVVEAMDRSHRLSARVEPKTYLNQTTSVIVTTIAGDFGLSSQVTATEIQHEYVLKTVNDRMFISELADAIGFEWYVDGTSLVFRPRPENGSPVADLSWDGVNRLLRLSARASALDGADTVNVRGWDDAQSTEIVGTASASSADPVAIGSSATLASTTYQSGATTFGHAMVLVPGVVMAQDEATARAKAIAVDLQSSTLRLTGECQPNASIKPGVWIKISDCGVKLSGDYYVTDVEHVIGINQSLVTRFRSGGRRAAGLAATPGRSGPAPFGQVGLVIGVVTNVKDDDRNMHRVKVRFPTLPNLESAWARMVTLGGSAASGMEARPDVDDEVLVGFEQGDPRRPFVLGGLLSRTDAYRTGSVNSDGSINKRGIRTRGGNKLELYDGDSSGASSGRYILLAGADGATELRLGDENMAMKTKGGNPITLESGTAKITLDNGKVTITADSIEIKATQGTKVEGVTVDLKGTQAVGIDGGTSFQAQAAKVSIAGQALTEVKGALLKLN
jgi:phage protein D/phage baseplate assembly protein gpV